jgi:hypothetical protein
MSIDPADKETVLMKKPFPFSLFLFYVCLFFPQLLLYIFSCCISVLVQVFLIVFIQYLHCWFAYTNPVTADTLCRRELVTYVASVLYKGLVLAPIP